jgi:hypothetical protein
MMRIIKETTERAEEPNRRYTYGLQVVTELASATWGAKIEEKNLGGKI